MNTIKIIIVSLISIIFSPTYTMNHIQNMLAYRRDKTINTIQDIPTLPFKNIATSFLLLSQDKQKELCIAEKYKKSLADSLTFNIALLPEKVIKKILTNVFLSDFVKFKDYKKNFNDDDQKSIDRAVKKFYQAPLFYAFSHYKKSKEYGDAIPSELTPPVCLLFNFSCENQKEIIQNINIAINASRLIELMRPGTVRSSSL